MNKRLAIGFIIFSLFIFCNFPATVSAEADINIDAKAGFANKVKYNRGVPLQITASNNGSAFSGDLVIDYTESYNIGSGLSVPLELEAGETKTFNIALPGMQDPGYYGGTGNQTIFLYEGGWEEGDSVKFSGSKSLKPNYYYGDILFIGTLTENADRLRSLPQLFTAMNSKPEIFSFTQQGDMPLPSDVLALDSLDYLIIDDYPYSDLSAETQQSVMSWLQQGGNIIIGAGSNLEASAGNLAGLLPLQLSSSEETAVPGFENPVEVFQAELNDGGEILLEENGRVYAAVNSEGAGKIYQTAFSLGNENVTSQEGYGALMSTLLVNDQSGQAFQTDESIKERMTYEMGMTNELFESFAVSRTVMFLIILLYIILVVPVLYIVLVKKDKREYAWIAIPAISILASLGIFAAGAKDRISNPQIQQTAFYEVDGGGGLNGYYMNTLLSNRSGDYQFSSPESTTMTATTGNQFSNGNTHHNAVLQKGSGSSQLTVRDMRYWSVASIIGESYINGTGEFDIQLTVENGQLTGTVRNGFPFSITDASIWTGTRLLALGDFNPDEEKQVNETIQRDMLQPISPISYGYGNQMIGSGAELLEARKQSALAMVYEHLGNRSSAPYVIGYTSDAITPVSLVEQDARVSAVNLLAQSFEPALNFNGDVTINPDNFTVDVTVLSDQGYIENYPENPQYYGFEPGQYLIRYELPSALASSGPDWSKLDIRSISADVEFSIYRFDTQEFEDLPAGSVDLTENIGNYLSDEGTIEIRINKNSQHGYSEITLPQIELEGVVAP